MALPAVARAPGVGDHGAAHLSLTASRWMHSSRSERPIKGTGIRARSPQTVVVGGEPEERPRGQDPGSIRTPHLTIASRRRLTAYGAPQWFMKHPHRRW